MTQVSTRDTVLESLKTLPDDASLDDIIEHLVFMAKLEEGLSQSQNRDLIPHEVVAARFAR
ncbi:MAG: hypothetical protein RLZZ156_1764 [Deinococcota bacterium]|jgi:hypothetical protein